MTAAALDAVEGEPTGRTGDPAGGLVDRAPVGPAGMDGIARLAARVVGASTAAVVLGSGEARRVVAVAGGDEISVFGPHAALARLSSPLIAPDGQLRGSLEVFGDAGRDDEETRDLLADLAAQAVALLELHRTTSELARTAGRDPLTGLPNRRTVERAISSAIVRAERGLGTPSVVVVALDGFAEVNSAVGSAVGDSVLRSVGERLVRTARTVDTVGRLGGDEFVVLLEHTGGPGAAAALDRLRRSLAEEWTDQAGVAGRVGASMGITTYRPGDSVASMLARADAEMYAEKARLEH